MSTGTEPAVCVDGVLAGRYRFTERIAVGGMGEVWAAQDEVLDRPVAVKLLRPEFVDDAEFRERFRAEARHAAGLSHPGIASVFDYGEQVEPQKAAWLVMELVDGEPLSALLRRTPRLPAEQVLDIVGQSALALEAAHLAGVVHRDVKPGNLLVRPDGVVKVTDFGIARATDAVPLTRTGTMVGTAYYLSPEQAAGRPVTPASDVYSLGVVAYECLAGARPFPGDNPIAVAAAHLNAPAPELPGDVPASVRALVARALAKDPAARPAHAGELGRAALALRRAMTAPTELLTADGLAATGSGATSDGPAQATTVLPAGAAAPAALASLLPPRPSRRPPPPRHRAAVRLASVLLAVLLLALAARSCAGPDGAATPTPREQGTASPSPSAGPPTVTVDAARYLGRPAAAVSAELAALGLRTRLVADGRGRPAGTVSAVSPVGAVAPAAVVTVHVVPAPPPEHRKGRKGDKGNNNNDD